MNGAQPWFRRPLTHRDLDDMPEDGARYEVIDGELHVSPFPGVAHQRVVARLQFALETWLRAHPVGELFPSGTKLVIDDPTGVGPDLFFVGHERLGDLRDDGYYGTPDLVVEVVSSKPSLDTVVKLRKYESAGVPRYWILHPQSRELHAFVLRESKYELEASLRGDAVFHPSAFPGLQIELATLWR